MKMWVIYSDYGLNGAAVHGIYSTEPDAQEVEKWTNTHFVTEEGFHVRISGITGYGGTFIEELEVDKPKRL